MTIQSKATNTITDVSGHKATVHGLGKTSEQLFVNPTSTSTIGMGGRVEFSLDFDISAGRVLKDLYLRYKFKNKGATTTLHSRFPLVEAIQEVRVNVNNGSNYYLIQGGEDANQMYHLPNLNKYANPQDFEHCRRTHGPTATSANTLLTNIREFEVAPGSYSEKGVHRLRLCDLIGDIFHNVELEYLKSLNLSILLKSGVDANENRASMGISGGTETLAQCVQFEEIEMEVHQEVYCQKLGARKPYLVRHHPYVESKTFSAPASGHTIVKLRNEFSPLKNIQYINAFIKSASTDVANASYSQAKFKSYCSHIHILLNGQIWKRFKTMNDLEDFQKEYKESAGVYPVAPNGTVSQEDMDAVSRVDGIIPMCRTLQKYDPASHEMVNGIENSSTASTSGEYSIEFYWNSTVPSDAVLTVNVIASRSYHYGNSSVNHKVNMSR